MILLSQRAKDRILEAQEDLRDAVRETDDLLVCAALGEAIAKLNQILDLEEGTR